MTLGCLSLWLAITMTCFRNSSNFYQRPEDDHSLSLGIVCSAALSAMRMCSKTMASAVRSIAYIPRDTLQVGKF